MRRTTTRLLGLVAGGLLLAARPAAAQQITISGTDQSRAAQIARAVVARGNYLRVGRDTVLPATFHATGDVVILGPAEVKLEGQVDGSIAIIGGQLYLRPGSRVGGPIGVLGGGIYPSARAQYDEIAESNTSTAVTVHANASTAATDTAGADDDDAVSGGQTAVSVSADTAAVTVGVDAPPRRPVVRPLLAQVPGYNRVDGFSASAGLRLLARGTDQGPTAEAWGTYYQYHEHWGGGARVGVPLWGREVRAVAEASRASRSPDSWAIGDIANSAAAAVMGSDYRNYYRSDRVSLTVGRNYWRPLISPESWLGPRAGIQVEKATSVDQRATWSLFHGGGLDRENPPIDEGTIVSAIVGFGYKKRWPTSRFDGDAQAERGIASAGDFGFTQFTADGHYQARTFRMHTLDVRFHTVLPIAGDSAPRQRWYILGGSPTLPTVGVGHYRGDHLAYVASTYGVPLPLMLPFIGQPTAEAWYATGAAWVTGDRMPRWTQNLGAGVSFPLVHVRVVIDPASDRLSPKLQAWVSVPGT